MIFALGINNVPPTQANQETSSDVFYTPEIYA
jgi:hypothetical protein